MGLEITKCEYCGADMMDGECTDVMRKRFDEVTIKGDWRAPIDALIPYENLRETRAAIEFFTATKAEDGCPQTVKGIRMVRVTAVGYRNGPAGS